MVIGNHVLSIAFLAMPIKVSLYQLTFRLILKEYSIRTFNMYVYLKSV